MFNLLQQMHNVNFAFWYVSISRQINKFSQDKIPLETKSFAWGGKRSLPVTHT